MKFYNELLTQSSAVSQSWERLSHNRARDWDLYGYDIGIHPLNMAIGGLIPTRLTVIGGRSGSGKTAMSSPMFEASVRPKSDGSRTEYLFFTWELDPSIVIDRNICSRVGLTLRQLNQGAKLLSEKTMADVKAAYSVASKFPIHYHTHTTNIGEVVATTREFIKQCKEKGKIEGVHIHPVVVIDYLNMAQFDDSTRTYGIGDFMNGLKALCNQERISAVVFAQLSREVDKSKRLPDRADFSDSSSIENAADNLIVIYRPEYHGIPTVIDPDTQMEVDSRGKLLVRVLKGRDYGIGDFLINCDIKHFRFWDANHSFEHPYWKDYTDESFWVKEFNLKTPIPEPVKEELPF